MRKPSRRIQRVLAAATTPVAVVAAVAMVYQATEVALGERHQDNRDGQSSESSPSDPPPATTPAPPSGMQTPSAAPSGAVPAATDPSSPTTPVTLPPENVPPDPEPPETVPVSLTDDDNGAARFSVSNMVPGDTGRRCIKVTARADRPGIVKGYAVNAVTSDAGLEDHILVSISDGEGGSFTDCAGFVADATVLPSVSLSAMSSMDSFDDGIGAWIVSPGTSTRVYQVSWKFDTTGLSQAQVNALQGTRAGIDLQWEMRRS